ncbi:methyl-accepting chemotaxis protein [Geobacter sp. AOG1]|uniref:methyl-accepting chemotaxis protein n=1 Tax=Geobacter sp. AOG1 TaxID=1566346 RepID=UPI001CC3ADA7|nr:methyl-accepting chemotaxis protein [Geobacter sp. AOG1]
MNSAATRADSYPDHSREGCGNGDSCHSHTTIRPSSGRLPFQWPITLDRTIGELKRLPVLSEEKFLQAGANLRVLVGQLRDIEQSAAAAGQLMADEGTQTAIRELEDVLDRMESHFHGTDKVAERAGCSLAGILGELDTIHRLMNTFKEQVGNLRMLKILTNIQSACHGGHGAGFRNVATDINTLSGNIQAKSSAIISRIKWLHGDLDKAVSMAGELGKSQKHLGHKVVTAIRHNIASLAGMHTNCSGGAQDVSGRSAKIARDVSEVVVSLQFQDITRQQMEHVSETLVTLQKRIAANGEPVTAGEAAELCALQMAQLSNSRDELMAAINRITASLSGISQEATTTATNAHGLFRQADQVGHASLRDIEHGLASVVSAFADNVATNGRLNDIMLAVTKAMTEINTFAEDIEYLGSEIRLIALNAIIKAAQAGKDGAAFGVIAETVKHLSEDICRQAAAITASIHAITRHVTDLQHDLAEGAEEEDTASDVELRKDELAAAIARIREVTTAVTGLLARTDEASAGLAATIEDIRTSLDSREMVATLQREVLSPLHHLVATGRSCSENGATGMIDGLAQVEDRYTMQSERKVHQLFAVRGERNTDTPATGEHLGDNVEFF